MTSLYLYREGGRQAVSIVNPETMVCIHSGKTVDSIKQESGEDLSLLTWEELLPRIEAALEQLYPGRWHEIDIETWDDMLGVLPPEKWETWDGVSIFRMSEYTEFDYTGHYAKYKDRCFHCTHKAGTVSYTHLTLPTKRIV